jgi:excisionase family DNA binding protein
MPKFTAAATDSDEPLRAYSPEFVAEAIDYHVETIRDALRDGRLPGIKLGSHWRITHSTFVGLLRKGLPGKRP